MQTTLINKNVMLPVRTSIRLEPLFWTALHDIAAASGKTIHAVVQDINAGRRYGTLTSAVRVAVLEWYRMAVKGADPLAKREHDLIAAAEAWSDACYSAEAAIDLDNEIMWLRAARAAVGRGE